MNLLPMGDKAV